MDRVKGILNEAAHWKMYVNYIKTQQKLVSVSYVQLSRACATGAVSAVRIIVPTEHLYAVQHGGILMPGACIGAWPTNLISDQRR